MVTDAEAVEIIEVRLNKMGMCFKDKKKRRSGYKSNTRTKDKRNKRYNR